MYKLLREKKITAQIQLKPGLYLHVACFRYIKAHSLQVRMLALELWNCFCKRRP